MCWKTSKQVTDAALITNCMRLMEVQNRIAIMRADKHFMCFECHADLLHKATLYKKNDANKHTKVKF